MLDHDSKRDHWLWGSRVFPAQNFIGHGMTNVKFLRELQILGWVANAVEVETLEP